jgi:hypothetical protein
MEIWGFVVSRICEGLMDSAYDTSDAFKFVKSKGAFTSIKRIFGEMVWASSPDGMVSEAKVD